MSFLYFAYGSNLALRRLRSSKRAPSAESVAVGWMDGYRLVFDKVSKDKSGKCDCEQTGDPSDRVFGVVFRIAQADQAALDTAEGLGGGYEKRTVQVVTAAGTLSAATYIATRKDPSIKPYEWYKEHVLRGAREHGLPTAYVCAIDAIEAMPDPDSERASRERRIWAN